MIYEQYIILFIIINIYYISGAIVCYTRVAKKLIKVFNNLGSG